MSSGYIYDMNGVGDYQDYTDRAVAQFGDNDGTGGDNELLLGGNDPSSYVGGQMTWNADTNADGSWDTEWVPVQLTVPAGSGGVQFDALGANPDPLVYSGGGGRVHHRRLRSPPPRRSRAPSSGPTSR